MIGSRDPCIRKLNSQSLKANAERSHKIVQNMISSAENNWNLVPFPKLVFCSDAVLMPYNLERKNINLWLLQIFLFGEVGGSLCMFF